MVKESDLSIIIINYNTRELLAKNLKALEKAISQTDFAVEVIVVDNGSTDGSVELVRQDFSAIRLISLKKNTGFAHGNNVGIKHSHGRYILLLNSDVIILPGTLDEVLRFMDKHKKVGVATCKLVFPNGELDPACHRGFPTPWASLTYFVHLDRLFPNFRWFSAYHLGYLPLDSVHEIDSPSGAFYLIRREVIEAVGLLDEDYFMYGEDLDWSYRIKQAGWKIMYVPQTQAVHYKKQSGRASRDVKARRRATIAFYDTMKIFYRKHYNRQYPKLLMWLIFLLIDTSKRFNLWRLGSYKEDSRILEEKPRQKQ